jgi:hypothetical protein
MFFSTSRVARHRFALVQTQGLRRSDAAELLAVDRHTRKCIHGWPSCSSSRSMSRRKLAVVSSLCHRWQGAGRHAVADEGQVAVPLRTRARSLCRLRWGLGCRAAANEDYVTASTPTRARPPHRPRRSGSSPWRDGDLFDKKNRLTLFRRGPSNLSTSVPRSLDSVSARSIS